MAAGEAGVDGVRLRPGQLLYLPTGRHETAVAAPAESTLLLLGGVPLGEKLLMWWNFVAHAGRDRRRYSRVRAGEFGPVGGYQGDPLPWYPPTDAARLRRPS